MNFAILSHYKFYGGHGSAEELRKLQTEEKDTSVERIYVLIYS